MDNYPLALLIGLAVGVPLGAYLSLVSHRHEKVLGGTLAQIFHVIGAMAVASTPITVLATVFLGNGFWAAILTAFVLILIAFTALFVYAIFEQPALEREKAKHGDDQGWTAEKAKTSGL
jgi:hypothetical protein